MPKAKPYTTLSDERTGRWTNVEFQENRLVFVATKPNTHWITMLLTAFIFFMLYISLIQSPTGSLILGGFVVLVAWHLISSKSRRHATPIVISKTAVLESESSCTYHVKDIRRFVIRENHNRDKIEDSHLLQIYMELRNEPCLVLLYQDYFAKPRNKDTRAIFGQMLSWLKNARQQNVH